MSAGGVGALRVNVFNDPAAIEAQIAKRASLRSEYVAEAVVFMLSQPPHVTIRDLVMLPQNQDL